MFDTNPSFVCPNYDIFLIHDDIHMNQKFTFRSLNDFTTEDIEKMNNVSFSDPEYTNKVPSLISEASQLSAIPTITGAPGGQLGLFLRLHPAVLRSECTH